MSGDDVLDFLGRDQSRGDDVPMVPIRIIGVIPNDQIAICRPKPSLLFFAC
jgi:hypothetical protein